MSDIVERLRKLISSGSWNELREAATVAADEIERLEEELKGAIGDLLDGGAHDAIDKAETEIERLRAEVRRLELDVETRGERDDRPR